jgi:hypothetical protein
MTLTLTAVTYAQVRKWRACGESRTHYDSQYQPTDTVTALDCITDKTLTDRQAIVWTLWLLAHTDRKTAVSLVCDCAERALKKYYKCDDQRPAEALALVRRWLAGEPITKGALRKAADAAYAAAADAADAADAYAAYAAAAAAYAAAAYAAYAAYAAAAADADAAYAAAYAAAYDAAYDADAADAERTWQRKHITAVLRKIQREVTK